MKHRGWVYWLVASIAVVLAGAALVAAAEERIEVKVENRDGNEVSVNVNGVEEVIHLDDLADGESRTFDVGDHSLTVARAGDNLTVTSEGGPFGALGDAGKTLDTMVWVEGEGGPKVGKKVIVMRRDGATGDGESAYTIELDGDEIELGDELDVEVEKLAGGPHAIFITKDGTAMDPMVLSSGAAGADRVKYRCEETGSVLLVDKDKAVADSYICPATGCVMTRVEEPEVKIVTIRKKAESSDE